jgi:hypothetical protein
MTVKIIQGLLGNSASFREIRTGVSATKQNQTTAQNQLAQQSAVLSSQGRSLSDAVVSSVRAGRSTGISSEKIREYREAKEVSGEVAEKIREGEDGSKSHQGLERSVGDRFSN